MQQLWLAVFTVYFEHSDVIGQHLLLMWVVDKLHPLFRTLSANTRRNPEHRDKLYLRVQVVQVNEL
jgi:hypothetical protein